MKTTRKTHSVKYCHRCGSRYNTQKLLDEHLQSCDPWALDRPCKTRKTYLPEVRNGRPPTVHFKQHHQIFDVPLYVVADCETYREGNSNAHVASFAYCVVGSDLYAPPPEHRYKVFLDEEGDSAVGCMARGLQALMEELWLHARSRSQARPLVNYYNAEDF